MKNHLLVALFFMLINSFSYAIEQIGGGYNFFTEEATLAPCIDYDLEWQDSFQTRSEIYTSMSREDFIDVFDSKVSIGGFTKFINSDYASFTNSLKFSSKSSQNMYFMVSIDGLTARVKNQQLNKHWRSSPSKRAKLERCGDSYISSAVYGGFLGIVFKMDFFTEQEKESFLRTTSLSVGGLEDFVSSLRNLNGHTNSFTIDIQLIQVGGNPLRLHNSLANNTLTCSSNNLTSCQRAGDIIVDYVTEVDGFHDQITRSIQDEIKTWRPLRFEYKPYSSIDPSIDDWGWSGDLVKAKDFMIAQGWEYKHGLHLVNERHKVDISGEARIELERINLDLSNALNEIGELVNNCRNRFDDCQPRFKNLFSKLKEFEALKLKFPIPHFKDYCMLPFLDGDAYHTVEMVAKEVGSSTDDCELLFRDAYWTEAMDLSHKDIVNPKPLASLKQIKFLDVSHNQIENDSGLKFFEGPIMLDFSYNKLDDIHNLYSIYKDKTKYLYGFGNPHEILKESLPYHADFILSRKDACTKGLEALVIAGEISEESMKSYKSVNFGPGVDSNGNFTSKYFGLCDIVATEYEFLTI